eukprot:763236-Prorocentrum_minimum.AAC.1
MCIEGGEQSMRTQPFQYEEECERSTVVRVRAALNRRGVEIQMRPEAERAQGDVDRLPTPSQPPRGRFGCGRRRCGRRG